MIRRPGPRQPTAGPRPTRSTGRSVCVRGPTSPTCMQFHRSTPRGEHGDPDRWAVGRSFASRSSASRAPPRALSHCGSPWYGPTPSALAQVWQAYIARFSIEHTLRFFKQTLRWTTPKLRAPAAADRWTWLLILAYLQLRLARDAVADVRLPWQPLLPPERRTPARVRRGFSHLLPRLGSPASVPKPCGRSPGRPTGKRSPPAKRFPAVKLTP
jgi:hypothetical protein